MNTPSSAQLRPREALNLLLEGNRRFAGGRPAYPNQNASTRLAVASGQRPTAAILSCSDSQAPPEMIFDQGLGDLFVVRTVGNILDDLAHGSLEFGVEELNVPLIVVLGHQDCSVVKAAMANGSAHGRIDLIYKLIRLAVYPVSENTPLSIQEAVMINACHTASILKSSQPVIASRVQSGALEIIPAYYEFESGLVSLIG